MAYLGSSQDEDQLLDADETEDAGTEAGVASASWPGTPRKVKPPGKQALNGHGTPLTPSPD